MENFESQKRRFFITLVKRIKGKDVPMMSTEDREIRELTESIRDLAMAGGHKIMSFEFAQDQTAGESADAGKKTRVPPQCRIMSDFVTDTPESGPLTADRNKLTLDAIRFALRGLEGEKRNFMNVLKVLRCRWNANIYRHLNDAVIASIVRLLRSEDEGVPLPVIDKKLAAILGEIDAHTEEMDENRFRDAGEKERPSDGGIINFNGNGGKKV